MKILYILNVPSPYRVDYFNELGKYCDLTVLFERESSEERDASWLDFAFKNFKGIFLEGKSYKVDSSFCPSVVKYLKRNRYDYIICANFTSPTGMLAIEYMRLRGIKYYLESDGGFPKSGKGFVAELQEKCQATTGQIASIVGRYYAMDRDKRWERVKEAYDLLVKGVGKQATDMVATGIPRPIPIITRSCFLLSAARGSF